MVRALGYKMIPLITDFFRDMDYRVLCEAKPNLRHVQQDGPRLRALDGSCHLHAFLREASILF